MSRMKGGGGGGGAEGLRCLCPEGSCPEDMSSVKKLNIFIFGIGQHNSSRLV